ncbi:hypothetical protein G7085_12965 [Tessaracoccus sp. HDW20]|uniref:hypothetical protein n=1 Tax=Tessaracoccus coleopterorum TaxID=2714950 RepID=UPI0018D3D139|nr:hypothetical protein [Tessaracoccus coleopterorum]NHB85229.1 hypothetical protein [Tessaracoccus coleopterorum]
MVLMMFASMLMIGSFASIEAAMVATFGDGSVNAGIVLAISSVGSLIGGLFAGNRQLTRWS